MWRRTREVVLVFVNRGWGGWALIYSPSLFSDSSVKGLGIWEGILEPAPFMAAGGLSKFIPWASNPIGPLCYCRENSAQLRKEGRRETLLSALRILLRCQRGNNAREVQELILDLHSFPNASYFESFHRRSRLWKALRESWKHAGSHLSDTWERCGIRCFRSALDTASLPSEF